MIQRIGYYLGGFALGLIFLAFFLSGKRTSCAYGPEARVIKNINTKPLVYSEEFAKSLIKDGIDSLALRKALWKAKIDFSESDTRHEPCGIYAVEVQINDQERILRIENCDSLATIRSVK